MSRTPWRIPVAALVAAALTMPAAAARADIAATQDRVPGFFDAVAESALPGLWQHARALEFSGATSARPHHQGADLARRRPQIPGQCCVWMDDRKARAGGTTDQEVAAAVAVAGLTWNWSMVFNRLQVDFDRFRAELAGN